MTFSSKTPARCGCVTTPSRSSLRGGLQPVGSLTERLQLAMDNGARRVLLPLENKRDFLDVPGDVLDKLQIIFYSDPSNAAFRAMGLE